MKKWELYVSSSWYFYIYIWSKWGLFNFIDEDCLCVKFTNTKELRLVHEDEIELAKWRFAASIAELERELNFMKENYFLTFNDE